MNRICAVLLTSCAISCSETNQNESPFQPWLLNEAADKLFDQLKYGKVKIEIFKKYKLEEVVQAHKDLESRKIIGPAIIVP